MHQLARKPAAAPARLPARRVSAPLYVTATPAEEKTIWRTDPRFVAAVVARFGAVHVDASASPGHAIPGVLASITPNEDALGPRPWASYAPARISWPSIWLNPPWGPAGLTARWTDRAILEVDRGAGRVLVLVPESVSADWWWRLAERALVTYSLGRIGYVRPSGEIGERPGCGSSLFYLLPGAKPQPEAALVRWRDWLPPKVRRPRAPHLAARGEA